MLKGLYFNLEEARFIWYGVQFAFVSHCIGLICIQIVVKNPLLGSVQPWDTIAKGTVSKSSTLDDLDAVLFSLPHKIENP